MIQEFSVENFLSFREEQKISFVATSDKKLTEELTWETKPGGVKLLRMPIIYGANASGKTNLLKAIEAVWIMLFVPRNQEHEEVMIYQPFQLKKGQPTSFKIIFWIKSRRFHYELIHDEYTILYEKMMYSSDKDVLSLLYERKKGDPVRFGSTLGIKAKRRDDLIRETLSNHTILSTLNKKNIEVPPVMRELYEWMKNNLYGFGEYEQECEKIAEQAKTNPALKKIILELLNKADFNISDFQIIDIPLPEDFIQQITDSAFDDSLRNKMKHLRKIIFTHTAEGKDFQITFDNESAGTKVYFRLAKLLFDLKNQTAIALEDEIDKSLHYDLLIHFLETFLHTSVPSQLIFTTHNQQILSEDWLIRRDMIWFTERDRQTLATKLHRASDMGIHKNVSLMNAYRIGKLGAKPLLGSTYLNPSEE